MAKKDKTQHDPHGKPHDPHGKPHDPHGKPPHGKPHDPHGKPHDPHGKPSTRQISRKLTKAEFIKMIEESVGDDECVLLMSPIGSYGAGIKKKSSEVNGPHFKITGSWGANLPHDENGKEIEDLRAFNIGHAAPRMILVVPAKP